VTTRPWQTRVGILGCEFGAQAEFILRKDFFLAPIYSPPLWSSNRSFSHAGECGSRGAERTEGPQPSCRRLSKPLLLCLHGGPCTNQGWRRERERRGHRRTCGRSMVPGSRGSPHSLLCLRRIRPANSNSIAFYVPGGSASTSGRGAFPRHALADPDLQWLLEGEGGRRRGRVVLVHRWSFERGDVRHTCLPARARGKVEVEVGRPELGGGGETRGNHSLRRSRVAVVVPSRIRRSCWSPSQGLRVARLR
jgi:hypothetical protein